MNFIKAVQPPGLEECKRLRGQTAALVWHARGHTDDGQMATGRQDWAAAHLLTGCAGLRQKQHRNATEGNKRCATHLCDLVVARQHGSIPVQASKQDARVGTEIPNRMEQFTSDIIAMLHPLCCCNAQLPMDQVVIVTTQGSWSYVTHRPGMAARRPICTQAGQPGPGKTPGGPVMRP